MARATSQSVVLDLSKQVGEVPGGGYKPESSGRRLPLLFFFVLSSIRAISSFVWRLLCGGGE